MSNDYKKNDICEFTELEALKSNLDQINVMIENLELFYKNTKITRDLLLMKHIYENKKRIEDKIRFLKFNYIDKELINLTTESMQSLLDSETLENRDYISDQLHEIKGNFEHLCYQEELLRRDIEFFKNKFKKIINKGELN